MRIKMKKSKTLIMYHSSKVKDFGNIKIMMIKDFDNLEILAIDE